MKKKKYCSPRIEEIHIGRIVLCNVSDTETGTPGGGTTEGPGFGGDGDGSDMNG